MVEPFTPEFRAWQQAPGMSAIGAGMGLTACWLVGAWLILGMVEIEPGTARVSVTEFALWMAGPLVIGVVACVNRRIRYFAGALVPGLIAGWSLGCLSFVAHSILLAWF